SRRTVFAYLKQKEAVAMLFRDVAPKIAERPGGYTRILKTGFRQGDAAEMCFIELVDFNEVYTTDKKAAAPAKKTRRAGAAKKVETAPAAAKADVVADAQAPVAVVE
ncbi:MAG: 50S ribosomal protein L17, partial [Mucinivorans sp.]